MPCWRTLFLEGERRVVPVHLLTVLFIPLCHILLASLSSQLMYIFSHPWQTIGRNLSHVAPHQRQPGAQPDWRRD